MKNKIDLKGKYLIVAFVLIVGIIMMILPSSQKSISYTDDDNTLILEQKISKMISDTFAIEKVSVILTYDTNGEKIYEPSKDSKFINSDSESHVKSEKLPYVRGALIAVDNIDVETSEKIKNAISVLLGISSNKVTVIYN